MTSDIRIKIGLEGVPQVQAGAQQAAQSLSRVGDAADITSRQARLLTRNFGDAVRALSGGAGGALGEAAQRVGQLGIAFGGFEGIAARITPATAAVGGLAAAGIALAVAYKQGKAESDAYARALILSGNAAGTTVGQLQVLAKAQADVAGSQGKAAEVLTQLAASGAVAVSEMAKATAAAIALERANGGAADATAKKFIELGNSPLQALIKINEAENFLSKSVYETVKALEKQGRTAEAAAVAQNAYADAVTGRAAQLEPRLGYLERAWRSAGDAAKWAWDKMLNLGREDTVESRLAQVSAELDRRRRVSGPNLSSRSNDLLGEQSVLQSDARTLRLGAAIQRQQAEEVKQQIAADKTKASVGATRDVYADLVRELQKLAATQEEEIETGGKATEARKLQIRLVDQLAKEAGKLTFAQRQAVAAEIALRVAAQESIDLQAAELKSAQEIAAARIDARKKEQQAIDEYLQKQRDATEQSLKGLNDRAQGLEDEEKAAAVAAQQNISLAEAIERVAIARLRERRAGLNDTADGQAAARDIDREIAARERLLGTLAAKAAREGAEKSAKELEDAYLKSYDTLSQGLTDALIQGGKSAADYIKGLFRTLILRPLLEPFVRPIAGMLAGASLGANAQGAVAQGAFGQAQQASTLFQAGKTIYDGFASGFASVGSSAANLYGTTYANATGGGIDALLATNNAYGTAGGAGGTGTAFGTAASTAAGAAVGVYGGRAISGGYAAFGGSGNGTVNAGTAIGAVVGSILPGVGTAIGAAVGGLIGGVVNRVFGRRAPEIESRAIEGTISGSNFSGSTVQNIVERGGLFRSDKRYSETQAITGDLDKALDEGAQQLTALAARYGAALGLPAEQLAGVTTSIKVAVTDSAEDNAKAIADALQQYADALLGSFADDVEPFRKSGETVAQTIERVGGALLSINDSLELLGVQALATSVDGGKAALALADLFGDANTFATAAASYYQKFYSEAERADRATAQITETLAQFGLQAPATRDDFRALVEAQDLTTQSGRETFAALLGVSDAFDALQTAAGDTAQALAEVVQQRQQLEGQLLQLQGNTAELRARERDALDQSNRALYDQIKALEDQAEASRLAADAAEEAAKAAEQLAARQRSIAGGVDSVIGDFLSGGALANYRATRVQEILAEGGIESTVPGILGSTRADILRLWEAVGVDGREAILSAYGAWKDLQDILYGTQRAVDAYRSGPLADQIEQARLGSLSPADRVARLRSTEARLFGQIATADDPVAVAEQLAGVVSARFAEEARLQQELGDTTIDSLRKQLDAAKSLRDVVAGIPQFTSELRIGDRSPLSARQQIDEAQRLFDSTVVRARGGDQVAIGNLQRNAQLLIDEATSAFGGTGRAATIFGNVTATLDEFAAQIGQTVDPQIAALEAQVTAAETTAENSTAMLEALLSIDAALGGRVGAGGGSVAPPINTPLPSIPVSTTVVDLIATSATTPTAAAAEVSSMLAELRAIVRNTAVLESIAGIDQAGFNALRERLLAAEAIQSQILEASRPSLVTT